jgi:ketosteroid isomerase-like protein
MSLREQLLQTARAYLAAHNERDFDRVLALCSPTCVHRMGPISIRHPGRNNEDYIAFNSAVFKRMNTYHAAITDVVADEVSHKVVLYLHAKATADAGEYENEYMVTLTMTDDGKRVVEQYEFIDSLTMTNWIAKVGKAAQDNWKMK